MAKNAKTSTPSIPVPVKTIRRPGRVAGLLASDTVRELTCDESGLPTTAGDSNSPDFDEMALENMDLVSDEVPVSELHRRSRRLAQDVFIPIEQVAEEDIVGPEFFNFTGDPAEKEEDEDFEDDEIEYEGATPLPNGRDIFVYGRMASEASHEESDRASYKAAADHLAKLAARDQKPVPAPVIVPTPIVSKPAEPSKVERLAILRDTFKAAVETKLFAAADAIDAQIKALTAEIEADKAQAEREAAKVRPLEEAKDAERRISFLRGKVATLREYLHDPTKEVGELIAISSAVARYEWEIDQLQPKLEVLAQARAEAEALKAQAEADRKAEIASRPAPTVQAPKVIARRCKVCGKVIEGDVMVPHFGEIERRRQVSLEPSMTVEQIYGDFFFDQKCMGTPVKGIQGRAYTLGHGNMKANLEIWCNGRGRRAQAAEERQLSRNRSNNDPSRPSRTWSSAPPAQQWKRTA